jgi:hypothetical protein
LAELPDVPAFPTDVFPAALADYVEGVRSALACPADFVGVPVLVLSAAALGASRALEVKPTWRELPCIYAICVGRPGSAKSPALKEVATPVYERQHALKIEHDAARERYEQALAVYDPPAPQKDVDPEIAGLWSAVTPPPPEKPVPPVLRRLYVGDATIESIAVILRDNPRGVAVIRDEAAAFVTGLNQYKGGKGADKQFFLAAWAGEPVTVDRKNHKDGPIMVPHPFLTFIGGLPPDLLTYFRGWRGAADGFLDRLLFAYPELGPAAPFRWDCLPDHVRTAWRQTLDRLHLLSMETNEHGSPRPRLLHLTECGRVAFETLLDRLTSEVNTDGFPNHLWGPWAKLRGYAARLSLCLHCLRFVHGETDSEDVDGESVRRADRLVAYFQGQARRVYHALEADPSVGAARSVLAWIARKGVVQFTKRDAFADLRRTFASVDQIGRPLGLLCQHGFLRLVAVESSGPGRKPSATYTVNPLLCTQNTQNTRN